MASLPDEIERRFRDSVAPRIWREVELRAFNVANDLLDESYGSAFTSARHNAWRYGGSRIPSPSWIAFERLLHTRLGDALDAALAEADRDAAMRAKVYRDIARYFAAWKRAQSPSNEVRQRAITALRRAVREIATKPATAEDVAARLAPLIRDRSLSTTEVWAALRAAAAPANLDTAIRAGLARL